MNKKQKTALTESMKLINSIVNAGCGNFSEEFGQPCMAEFAVSGIVTLEMLQDSFPEVYKNAFENEETPSSEIQTEFNFVP